MWADKRRRLQTAATALQVIVGALVRARKNKIQTLEAGSARPTAARPAHAGRALPTLCISTVKDWRRSFWSAVLQHRFRFDWRDDFRVVQSSVQAEPRTAASSDPASPSNAEFTSHQSAARQSTAFVAAFCERRPFLSPA